MKRSILSVVMVLLVCTGAYAESSVWKVQKGKSVAYLGATFHLLRRTDYPLPPEFDKAYRAAAIIVFEADINKLKEPATQLRLQTKAMYADGSTVDKHLSAPAYEALRAYCETSSFPLQEFSRYKPSILMVTLTLMELIKMGASRQGVDEYFYELATREKKVIEGLETVDEQIDYLVSMADGNEDEFVTYSLRDMLTIRQQFDSIVNAWRKGDAEKLDALLIAELKALQPKLYKKLITDRNRNWLSLIAARQNQSRTRFILVGMGHLVGPDGIIEALKKQGYKVDRL